MYKCKQENDTYSFQAEPCADGLQQQVIAKDKAGALRVISTEKAVLPVAPPSPSPSPTPTPTPSPVKPSIAAPSTIERTTTSQAQLAARPASNVTPRATIPADAPKYALTAGNIASLCVLVVVLFLIFAIRKNRAVAIDVRTNAPMSWPMSCTQCGTRNKLAYVSATAEKSETISAWTMLLGVHRYRTTRITMQYPACGGHAFKAQIASWVTGKIGVLISLFAGAYAFGLVDELLDGKWATMHIQQKVVQTVYCLLLLTWFSIFSLSHGWSPVRLSRWKKPSRYGSDTIRLLFSNEQYAQEFARANRKEHGLGTIGGSSWFNAIQWTRVIFYCMVAALAWMYLTSKYT